MPDVRFLSALRRGNVHGALDAGLAPGFLPGRVTLDAGREWFTERVGRSRPPSAGSTPTASCAPRPTGKIDVLVLLGADPLADFPDAGLAERALDGAGIVIAVDAFLSDSAQRADVFLPCTLWGEKTGSVTNLEGRVQRVGRKVAPEGTAMDDWRIAAELALRLGHDFDLATVDEVTDEMRRVAPAHLGVDSALLRRARDGVVLPLREHLDEIVLRTGDLSILADDGSGDVVGPDQGRGRSARRSRPRSSPTSSRRPPRPSPRPNRPRSASGTASSPTPTFRRATRTLCASWSGRTLYDNGRMVSEAAVARGARAAPVLRVNPHELARLGVERHGGAGSRRPAARSRARSSPTRRFPRASRSCRLLGRRHRARAASSTRTQPVTDLRVETLRVICCALDPLFAGGDITWSVFAVVADQGRRSRS